jgi:release factor glutamine methyltransferase
MIHRLKKILSPILIAAYRNYQTTPRRYSYAGFRITVAPGVFHPGLFISTGILLRYIGKMELTGKRFLELGCGTGILSLLASSRGAVATATDINPAAVGNARENAIKNRLEVETIESDLFAAIPGRSFDLVVINPPYYPKDPADLSGSAWFCGSDFGFFKRLFPQLRARSRPGQQVLMILSQDCDENRIRQIALDSGIALSIVHTEKRWGEWNYIYSLQPLI